MIERIAEYDIVVLTQDLPTDHLKAGDVGLVLTVHPATVAAPLGYTVEITTVTGETAAVIDVFADQVRPVARTDRLEQFVTIRNEEPSP